MANSYIFDRPAKVISTSYGYNEADLTPFYTARQCNEYAKLGMMGVTVLYSSGDNGVAGNGALCLNSDGSQTTGGTVFNPRCLDFSLSFRSVLNVVYQFPWDLPIHHECRRY